MEAEEILFLSNHTWRKKQQAICIQEVGACHHEFQVIIHKQTNNDIYNRLGVYRKLEHVIMSSKWLYN